MDNLNKDKIILHLFAKKGTDSQDYADNGYDRRIVGKNIGVENFHPPEKNVYGIIANPVCKEFSKALTTRQRDLKKGMRLVKECLRIIWECQYRQIKGTSYLKFWVIENPASGYLKYFLGKPVFEYSQSEYGELQHKKTALWGYFNIPKRPLLYNPIPSKMTEGKKWGNKKGDRSNCPILFAKAFYEANQ